MLQTDKQFPFRCINLMPAHGRYFPGIVIMLDQCRGALCARPEFNFEKDCAFDFGVTACWVKRRTCSGLGSLIMGHIKES